MALSDEADCEEEDDYEADPDSGPYCSHYREPWDCDELCKCGDRCDQHRFGGCNRDDCDCEEFVDAGD